MDIRTHGGPNCSNVEQIERLRSQQQTTFRTKIFKRLDASTNSLPEGWRQSVVQVVDGKATDVPSTMSPMVSTDSPAAAILSAA